MQFDIIAASIVAVPAIYGAFLGFRLVSGLIALWQGPIASTAPESTATDHIANAVQMEPRQVQGVPVTVPSDAPAVVSPAMSSDQAAVLPSQAGPGKLAKTSVFPIDLKALLSAALGVNTPPIKDTEYSRSVHIDLATIGDQRAAELEPAFIPNSNEPSYSDADRRLVDAHAAHIARYWQQKPTDNIVQFNRPLRGVQKAQQRHPAIEGMTLRAMRQLGAELRIKGARRWNKATAIEQLTRYYQQAA